jgi:hypothetical protein
MNGAPRIAPSPISSPWALLPRKMAIIGMIVSGIAVPTAAKMLPVAVSASPSLRPSHSMPFVNTSQLSRMTRRDAISMATLAISTAMPAPAPQISRFYLNHSHGLPSRSERGPDIIIK